MRTHSAVVQSVSRNRYDGVIVISDIHGDIEGSLGVRNEVHFTPEDTLVIVGDILEKGARSLELLKTVVWMAIFLRIFGKNH